MTWTTPADLRKQLDKLWNRGDLLASLVTGDSLFPRRLIVKGPRSAEMTERFDDVKAWIGNLQGIPHYRVEMREFRHRLMGTNSIPAEVWIDHFDEAIAILGKRREITRFHSIIDWTRQSQPSLLNWLIRRPVRGLKLHDEWSRLLDIVCWMQDHPSPNVYLRQVDIPGVHSKFIEAHRGVLTQLLDTALSPEGIDFSAAGVNQFAKRYGFRDKTLRIRFRTLNSTNTQQAAIDGQDVTLDAETFSQLDYPVNRVFITENEINFLSFPEVRTGMVIFGAGYGFDMLRNANWLSRCKMYYWGDIDTHGFAILDQLRSCFEHAESFLMNRETLLEFESHWGEEKNQTQRDLPRLNADERSLYDDLRDNRIRKNLRLEQERISYSWVTNALEMVQRTH